MEEPKSAIGPRFAMQDFGFSILAQDHQNVTLLGENVEVAWWLLTSQSRGDGQGDYKDEGGSELHQSGGGELSWDSFHDATSTLYLM